MDAMSAKRDDEALPSYEEAERSLTPTPASAGRANEVGQERPMTKPEEASSEHSRASRIQLHSADSYYGYHTGLDDTADDASSEGDPDAPPAYSNTYGKIVEENGDVGTNARVGADGRVNITINQHSNRLTKILVPALRHQLHREREHLPPPPPYIPPSLGGQPGQTPPPPLNVVIHVVGSRGDVQPFVALGKVLKDTYNHRVRLATHPTFKKFVEENDLEFFSIGGDPAELMAFMVKNPGLMPGFDSLRSGDVGKRRKQIAEMIKGCWRSCYEAGDGMAVQGSDQAIENWIESTGQENVGLGRPFVADAIIANPPSFAHIHCAERLGIPLHMMFTMPWSPTQVFPHPLANIQSSNADPTMTNYVSYALVDMLTWQGLGDVINRFRVHNLGLEPMSLVWAPGALARMKIPYTYCWSPALIPKPGDWGPFISISGFFFLNLASNYTPDPELDAFLKAGPPPVYIGFGSIVVDDPNAMTNMIFEAVKKTGQRALVSKGWGGLGADQLGIPEGVYMLGNVPHDWLFQHVSCVVHHGGAGTTAAGIKAGRPTVVVPFFGDQPFWGAMVAKAGAGPTPIPYKQLTAEKLAQAITEALKPESLERAKELASKISEEKGTDVGAQCFHQMLDMDKMRCSLLEDRAAVWRVKRTQIRLSALAAYTLAEKNIVSFDDLKLYRPKEYEVDDGPMDPITGGGGAIMGVITSVLMGVADFPIETLKALKIHPDAAKAKIKEKKSQRSNDSASSSPNGQVSAPMRSQNRSTTTTSDSASRTSLLTSPSETSVSMQTPPTSMSSIKRKPLPPGSPVTSPRSRPLSRQVTDDIPLVQSPISSVEEPNLLAPRSQHSRNGSSSMSEALRNLPESSRPHSPSRSHSRCSRGGEASPRSTSPGGTPVPAPAPAPAPTPAMMDHLDTAMGTGKGLSRIIGASLKSPMDFSLALAKGFHNMPKLYGEEVRQVDRVTGFKSGITTASKEFGHGLYDGITGLVTQPVQGAKKEGAAGFLKGFGKGLAGIYIKPSAGAFGIPGYMFKGIYKEYMKKFGESTDAYLSAARTAEGFELWQSTTREFRIEIVHKYLQVLKDTNRKRGIPGEDGMDAVAGGVEAVEKFIERRKVARRRNVEKLAGLTRLKGKGKKKDFVEGRLLEKQLDSEDSERPSLTHTDTVSSDNTSVQHQGTISSDSSTTNGTVRPNGQSREPSMTPLHHYEDEDELYEDPTVLGEVTEEPAELEGSREPAELEGSNVATQEDDDDAELEEAIRQSIAHSSRGKEEDDMMIDRAIRASIAELRRQQSIDIEEEEAEDEDLKRVLTESARLNRETVDGQGQESGVVGATGAGARRDVGEDEDEEEQLRRAVEESLKIDEEREKEKREEEIIMEYVKKASLAEEEFRRRITDIAEGGGSESAGK